MSFLIREISNLSPFKIKILSELSKRSITRNLLMSIYHLKRTTAFDILQDLEKRNLLESSKPPISKKRGKPARIYKLSETGYRFIKLFKPEKPKEPIKKKVIPKKPTIKKKPIKKKPTIKKPIKEKRTLAQMDAIAHSIKGYTIPQLKDYCKTNKIKGYSKLNKNQLRLLISRGFV